MAEDFFDAGEATDEVTDSATEVVGADVIAEVFGVALEARAVTELFGVLVTKARTGMRKDLKLLPAALTVR